MTENDRTNRRTLARGSLRQGVDASLLDLKEIRRRAQRALDWDGGCALPPDVPPEAIILMVDEIERLREEAGER